MTKARTDTSERCKLFVMIMESDRRRNEKSVEVSGSCRTRKRSKFCHSYDSKSIACGSVDGLELRFRRLADGVFASSFFVVSRRRQGPSPD